MLQKTFGYLICIIIGTCGLFSELYAGSFAKKEYKDYADCKKSVSADASMEAAFHPTARYKEILAQLEQESKTKLETYKNTPLTKAIRDGYCAINYQRSGTYNCEVGQKPIDCMPSLCWAIEAKTDPLQIKNQAEKDYTEERIKAECAKYENIQPTPAPQTQPEAPKQDNGSAAGAATTPAANNDAQRAQQDAARQAEQERKAKEKEEERRRKAEEKAKKAAEEEKAKQEECAAKNPPQVAKKNIFGKWTCVDSDETKAAREEKKKNDKNLKAFWDDMDKLDKEFLKRVQELQKSNGGKK